MNQGIRKILFAFFTKYKYPKDTLMHALAKKYNIKPDELEQEVYSILTDFLAFGKWNERKDKNVKVDPEQLKMGMKVEMEHTNCPLIARKIALDHLSELSDYYSRLRQMEDAAKKKLQTEEIKGWKHAAADLAKWRSEKGKNIRLVSLKKDGTESKLHDASHQFRNINDAYTFFNRVIELNPTQQIKYNLYIDNKFEKILEK